MPITMHIHSEGGWDEIKEEFTDPVDTTIVMEHSLVSLDKWESKWKIPFLSPETKMTKEQLLDYYRCMTITQNVDPLVYKFLTPLQEKQLYEYMQDSMTATTISESKKPKKKNRDIQTSETIYACMFELHIPFECRKWHLNKLLMLIEVAAIRQQPAEKMSKKDQMAQQRALNNARRAKHRSKG